MKYALPTTALIVLVGAVWLFERNQVGPSPIDPGTVGPGTIDPEEVDSSALLGGASSPAPPSHSDATLERPGNRDAERKDEARSHRTSNGSALLAHVDPAILPVQPPLLELIDPDGTVHEYTLGEELSLSALPAGNCALRLQRAGWRVEPNELAVDSGTEELHEVLLSPTNEYRGRVLDEATGEGVTNFTLTPVYRDPGAGVEMHIPLSTDGAFTNGEFHIGGIPLESGEVMLVFEAPEYHEGRTDWLLVRGGTLIENLIVELRPDDAEDGWISARVAGPGGPMSAQVTVLKSAQEAAFSGIQVDRNGVHPWGGLPMEPEVTAHVVSVGRAGVLEASVRPGAYQLLTQSGGHAPHLSELISVGAGERVFQDVFLEAGATVHGRLTGDFDPSDWAHPLWLQIQGDRVNYSPPVNEDREFELEGVAAGQYQALVYGGQGPNDIVTGVSFDARPGETTEVTIPCGPTSEEVTIRGQLQWPADIDGSSDINWLIGIVSEKSLDLGTVSRLAPAADGSFEAHGFPRERLLVAAMGERRGIGAPSARFTSFVLVDASEGPLERYVNLTIEDTEVAIERGTEGPELVDLRIVSQELGRALDFATTEMGILPRVPRGHTTTIRGLRTATYTLEGSGPPIQFQVAGETRLSVP